MKRKGAVELSKVCSGLFSFVEKSERYDVISEPKIKKWALLQSFFFCSSFFYSTLLVLLIGPRLSTTRALFALLLSSLSRAFPCLTEPIADSRQKVGKESRRSQVPPPTTTTTSDDLPPRLSSQLNVRLLPLADISLALSRLVKVSLAFNRSRNHREKNERRDVLFVGGDAEGSLRCLEG